MSMLLIIGFALIALGILMALPFFGIGLIIPVIGDIIDIPISFVLILLGSILLFIGGLGFFISEFWWVILIGVAIWYALFVIKIGVGKKRRK